MNYVSEIFFKKKMNWEFFSTDGNWEYSVIRGISSLANTLFIVCILQNKILVVGPNAIKILEYKPISYLETSQERTT